MKLIVNIEKSFDKKGIKYKISENNEWLRTNCLLPDHEDNTPSFSINLNDFGWWNLGS